MHTAMERLKVIDSIIEYVLVPFIKFEYSA